LINKVDLMAIEREKEIEVEREREGGRERFVS
jgi:hypothetical protein